MINDPCELVRQWLQQAARSATAPLPPDQLVGHVAGCPTCKGALLLMLTELLAIRPDVAASDCGACEPLLAAYLELELDVGGITAMRTYPLVAWHLWTCPACAELYRLTQAALAAARAGAFPTPALHSQARRAPPTLGPIRLTRSLLAGALPRPEPLLGAPRGPDRGPAVLYEAEEAGHLVSLAATHADDDSWTIALTVDPPVDGRFLLTIGVLQREAPLVNGAAICAALPASLIEDDGGPDLLGELVLGPGSG